MIPTNLPLGANNKNRFLNIDIVLVIRFFDFS